jgi:uncharacterized membrane protein YoaK (UPF0700 family)
VLIVLLSASMGVQSASVRPVGEVRVSTTYITGTLTSLAVDAATEFTYRWRSRTSRAETPRPAASHSPTRQASPLLFGIWSTYLGGALVGGFAQQRWGFWSVAAAAATVATVAGRDLSQTPRE